MKTWREFTIQLGIEYGLFGSQTTKVNEEIKVIEIGAVMELQEENLDVKCRLRTSEQLLRERNDEIEKLKAELKIYKLEVERLNKDLTKAYETSDKIAKMSDKNLEDWMLTSEQCEKLAVALEAVWESSDCNNFVLQLVKKTLAEYNKAKNGTTK